MSLTKKLTMGAKFVVSRLIGRTFPLAVQISLTNRCNFRCRYCRIHTRVGEDPPLDSVFRLLREFADLGTRRFSFTGGEPLLRNDIGQIIAYAKSLGASVSVISNGALVSSKLDVLRQVDSVCISIDGPQEVTDANRVPGAFAHASRACDALNEAGIPLHLNCVLTRNNAERRVVRFLLDFARRHGAYCGFLVMQTVPETSGDLSALYAEREALMECLDEIISAHRRGEPVLFSRRSYELARIWPDFRVPRSSDRALEGRGYPTCWAGRYFCNVDTDGMLYPCCLTIGEVPSENAYSVGVARALSVAAQHRCRFCMSPAWIDYNRLFSLKPNALWHALRSVNI